MLFNEKQTDSLIAGKVKKDGTFEQFFVITSKHIWRNGENVMNATKKTTDDEPFF